MENLPIYLNILFVSTVIMTLIFLYLILNDELPRRIVNIIIMVTLIWCVIQFTLAQSGFYMEKLNQLPPRLAFFGVLPLVLFMIFCFWSRGVRKLIAKLSMKRLVAMSIVRIPVEITLFGLAMHKAIPTIMSFEGWNFDIVAGIFALGMMFLLKFDSRRARVIIWTWNIMGTFLLAVIIAIAFLSAPFPLQRLAFDQPNIALLHAPFVLLPTFVAPMVLFSHFIVFQKLRGGDALI